MLKQVVRSKCKKSCSNLEYLGEVVSNVPSESEYENWNTYRLRCKLTNPDFVSKVFEEYLVYDAFGIIGSVGGTLGRYLQWLLKYFT